MTDNQAQSPTFPVVWFAVLALLAVCQAFTGSRLRPTVDLLKGRHGPFDSPILITTPIVERLGDANEVAWGPDGHRYRSCAWISPPKPMTVGNCGRSGLGPAALNHLGIALRLRPKQIRPWSSSVSRRPWQLVLRT